MEDKKDKPELTFVDLLPGRTFRPLDWSLLQN